MDADIEHLRRLLQDARRIVVFTGAGISTESGIPDFRSPGGVWSRQRPIDFDAFLESEEARIETWRRRFALEAVLRPARPNQGHVAVAALVRAGKAVVITQNVDGLHQLSGVPEEEVIELHGNTMYAACLDCGTRYEIEEIRTRFEREEAAPCCGRCGGFVKSAAISFGQGMPAAAMRRAKEATMAADVFLVLGSSLVVYPAAGFPERASRNGATLVIVNREKTRLDHLAGLAIHRPIGETLAAAVPN